MALQHAAGAMIPLASLLLYGALSAAATTTGSACSAQVDMDCRGDDLSDDHRHINVTQTACCQLCASEPRCKVSVWIPERGSGTACLLKANCSSPKKFKK